MQQNVKNKRRLRQTHSAENNTASLLRRA